MEEPENHTADSLKQTVKQGTVGQEERAQVLVNGKNEVPVGTVNEFKGHFRRAVNAVLIAAGRAEFRVAAERNKFKSTTVGTAVQGAAIRRVAAVDHLPDIFHNNGTGMKNILNFFVMFFKYLLKDVHETIMKEFRAENNPPLKIEGQGS